MFRDVVTFLYLIIYHMQIADKQTQESIQSMIKIQVGNEELETPIRLS
jgi:hypothetical protein